MLQLLELEFPDDDVSEYGMRLLSSLVWNDWIEMAYFVGRQTRELDVALNSIIFTVRAFE